MYSSTGLCMLCSVNEFCGDSGDMVFSSCGVQILFWPVGSTVASNRGIKYAV